MLASRTVHASIDSTHASRDDPMMRGKNLTGENYGIWRYRTGDYRALCDIDKSTLTILTLEISHRSKSYQRS